jgi:hypothetical protein
MRKFLLSPQKYDERDLLHTPTSTTSPDFFDLSNKLPDVFDQGHLGACLYNGGTAGMEFVLRMEGHDELLSRLFPYWYARTDKVVDSGSTIRDGLKSFTRYGTCREELWEYSDENPGLFQKEPTVPPQYKITCYKFIKQEQEHLESVLGVEQFPILYGLHLFSSVYSEYVQKTGKISLPKQGDKELGGHANLLVGYDRRERKFKSRNSWGSDFGDDGHLIVPYDYILNPELAFDFAVILSVAIVG